MASKFHYTHLIAALTAVWILNLGGCSTTELDPRAVPTPPVYTQVPHPEGNDITDISTIFLDPLAPKPTPHATVDEIITTIAKTCDAEFLKLMSLTVSVTERTVGLRELIKQDPVHYHWCYYAKIVELEKQVKSGNYLDENQKNVLQTYEFLVPVGKTFIELFRDSRYTRTAVNRYRKLSQWLFFRKLELTPQGTKELVQPVNPFGLWRDADVSMPVLEKFHMVRNPAAQPSVLPSPLPSAEADSLLPPTTPSPLPLDLPSPMPSPSPSGLTPAQAIPPTAPMVPSPMPQTAVSPSP